MNIGLWILVIIGGSVGALSTLYLAVGFPAVLIWKCYRRVVHRIPMTK